MNWKKLIKTLSLLIVGLVVLVVAGFATFVYNPFEGSFGELRRAVPYGVDFYVAKADLRSDFETFPVPAFWPDFENSPAFPKIRAGSIYKDMSADVGRALEEVRRIDAQLASIPLLGVSILGDAIGKDIAVAGRLRSNRSGYDVCAYTVVTWKVRAAIELLGFDFVKSRLPGMTVTLDGGIYELRGNAEPFWLTRVKDLVIAGTSKELVVESRQLATNESTADAIWTSADYNDHLQAPLEASSAENVVELMADLATLRDFSPSFASWPGMGQDVTQEQKLLRTFLTPKAMRRAWSSLALEGSGATLTTRLTLDPGELDDFQRRFQEANPGSVETWLKSFLRLVPYTAAFCATMRVPAGDFFRAAFRTMEIDAQNLIDDGLRRSGHGAGLDGLIDTVAPALEPWIGVVFRNNDYPRYKKEFEVAIPSPAPVWALVTRAEPGAGGRIEDLIKLFRENMRFRLKFDGQDFFIHVGPNKEQKIQEWGNRLIPGTGQIAVLYDDKSRDFIISNSGKLVREMVNARFSSDGVRHILAHDESLKRSIEGMPEAVSGFAWLTAARALNVVQGYQEFTNKRLQSQAADAGFLLSERGGVEKMILARDFPGRSDATRLSASEQKRFEELVNAELARRWASERSRLGRDTERAFREAAAWLEGFDHVGLVMRTRPKRLDLELRVGANW